MRSLAVLTTTAAMALLGAANAQETTPNANAAAQSAPVGGAGDVLLRDALTSYAAYQNDVSTLRASTIGAAPDLETALDVASRHNRDALTRGWIAYGAYTAGQSPSFVQGVRDAAAYYGKDAVVWAVTADTSYARRLRGGSDATRLVLSAAQADGSRIISVADRYQEMAYGLQRQRWANAVAPQKDARIQRVRGLGRPGGFTASLPTELTPRLAPAQLSLQPASDPTAFGGRRFWDAARGEAQVVEVASQVSYQWRINATRGEAVNRMTSIAALQALEAEDTKAETVDQMMTDPRSRDCLEMAQLQLYQCMSAARFRYENAFCLGQHALRDVGICISEIAHPDGAAMTPAPGGALATPASTR